MNEVGSSRPIDDWSFSSTGYRRSILASATVALALLSLLGNPPLAAQSPEGYWRQTHMDASPHREYGVVSWEGEAGNVSATIQAEVSSPNPPYRETQTLSGRWRWSPPPAILIPGQLVAVRLEGTFLVNSHPAAANSWAFQAWAYFNKGGANGFNHFRNGDGKYLAMFGNYPKPEASDTLYADKGGVVLDGTLTIPPHHRGETQAPVCIKLQAQAQARQYCYQYEWKEGPPPGAGPTPTASTGAAVDVSGTWRHGPGGETWTLTPSGPGRYTAVEKGFGNARGTAVVVGNKIRVDYVTADGRTKGAYEVTVSADGKSASGTWRDDGSPSGRSGTSNWVRVAENSPAPTPAPAGTREPADVSGMTLQAGVRQVKAGETVTVPVWLIKGAGVANMNFNLRYSAGVAQATAVAKGSVIPSSFLFESNPRDSGIVRVGFAGSSDLAGTSPVAQVTLKAVGQPGQRTPLRLEVTTISGASGGRPQIATIDGELVIVTAKGQVPGDSNGNGTLDAADALDALKMSVGLIPVKMVCDMDSDNQVTSTDARLILQKVVGK